MEGVGGTAAPGRQRNTTMRKNANARMSKAVTEMYAETEAALERAKADCARLEREKMQLTQERNDLQNTVVRINLERAGGGAGSPIASSSSLAIAASASSLTLAGSARPTAPGAAARGMAVGAPTPALVLGDLDALLAEVSYASVERGELRDDERAQLYRDLRMSPVDLVSWPEVARTYQRLLAASLAFARHMAESLLSDVDLAVDRNLVHLLRARRCAQCGGCFSALDNVSCAPCRFHPRPAESVADMAGTGVRLFTMHPCCNQPAGSRGCSLGRHVV